MSRALARRLDLSGKPSGPGGGALVRLSLPAAAPALDPNPVSFAPFPAAGAGGRAGEPGAHAGLGDGAEPGAGLPPRRRSFPTLAALPSLFMSRTGGGRPGALPQQRPGSAHDLGHAAGARPRAVAPRAAWARPRAKQCAPERLRVVSKHSLTPQASSGSLPVRRRDSRKSSQVCPSVQRAGCYSGQSCMSTVYPRAEARTSRRRRAARGRGPTERAGPAPGRARPGLQRQRRRPGRRGARRRGRQPRPGLAGAAGRCGRLLGGRAWRRLARRGGARAQRVPAVRPQPWPALGRA